MQVSNTTLPMSRVDISTKDKQKATVTLWNGKYTVNLSERHLPEDEPGSEYVYEYELYQISVPNRDGLKEAVEAAFDKWYEAAKKEESKRSLEAECAAYEKEAQAGLYDAMLEYEYRIMMLEELGGIV